MNKMGRFPYPSIVDPQGRLGDASLPQLVGDGIDDGLLLTTDTRNCHQFHDQMERLIGPVIGGPLPQASSGHGRHGDHGAAINRPPREGRRNWDSGEWDSGEWDSGEWDSGEWESVNGIR